MGDSDAAQRLQQSGQYWSSPRGFPHQRQQTAAPARGSRMSILPLPQGCLQQAAWCRGCLAPVPRPPRRNLQPPHPRPRLRFPARRFLHRQLPRHPPAIPSLRPPAAWPPPKPCRGQKVQQHSRPGPGARRVTRWPYPNQPGSSPDPARQPGRPVPPVSPGPVQPQQRAAQRPAAAPSRLRESRPAAVRRWPRRPNGPWSQPRCGWESACWAQREPQDLSLPGSAGSEPARAGFRP
jgi:hypothetical protein